MPVNSKKALRSGSSKRLKPTFVLFAKPMNVFTAGNPTSPFLNEIKNSFLYSLIPEEK
jgi:hypothetical protein